MIFKPILEKLNHNKTNRTTVIQQVHSIDENILNPLMSHEHEGIYGFEVIQMGDDREYYIVSPIDYLEVDGIDANIDYGMFKRSLYQLHCYSVNFAYPSFLPIQIHEFPLFQYLFDLKYPVHLFMQVLFYPKVNHWRKTFYDQYESYLLGNDLPSNTNLGRHIQNQLLHVIDKVTGIKQEKRRVKDIEDKIKDNLYAMSFKIMLYGDDNQIKIMKHEIEDILSTRNYFNQFILVEHHYKETYIDQYARHVIDIKHAPILSETELLSLFLNVQMTSSKETQHNHQLPQTIPIIEFLPNENNNEVIYLRQILEHQDFKQYAKNHPLPICFGIDEQGQLLLSDLTEIKHMLIAGATGSGKSAFENQIILTLLLNCQPSELEMYLIDPKFVELEGFNGFPRVKEVITDMEKVEGLMRYLINEMDQRYEFLRKKRYRSLVKYNEDHPKNKKPYIVCVIDEFADLMMTNPEVEEYIKRLGQKARAAGIHMIIATQRPQADIVSGIIKVNMPTKVSFRLDSTTDYRTVYGKSIPYHLLGKGDGVVRLEGREQEFIRFKSPVVTLDDREFDEVLDHLKKMYDDHEVQLDMESPKDRLKRIIANTGETRVRELQKEMGIRINDVQDLMSELVEEGWLIKHQAKSKGYELVVSDEELNKWKDRKF